MELNTNFTSTGAKMYHHEEAMSNLRNGKGQPITCHIMCTDICNHSCAFCSVQSRAGDVLSFDSIAGFIDILMKFGLKSCILSGGGNPILYRDKNNRRDFNDVVDLLHRKGLEIGLITNGMPMVPFCMDESADRWRNSWKGIYPSTLDKLTWIRVSMSGLDHKEKEVYVPDVDPTRTSLGFSYVAHDIYDEPNDPHHGKVSRPLDLIGNKDRMARLYFEERVEELTDKIGSYVSRYKPRYVRLLPNCLEPELIPYRCKQLKEMARTINFKVDREVAFVQHKPPQAPHACYLGYVHPVLNCDGYVYPCDSCVLNESANHSFSNPWRICHWSDVGQIYERPVKSLIEDPSKLCPGCVFTGSNNLLKDVVDGKPYSKSTEIPVHVNFV